MVIVAVRINCMTTQLENDISRFQNAAARRPPRYLTNENPLRLALLSKEMTYRCVSVNLPVHSNRRESRIEGGARSSVQERS